MSESRAPALAAVSLAAVFGLTGCSTSPNNVGTAVGTAVGNAVGAAATAAASAVLGGNTGSYPPPYYGPRPDYYNTQPPVCRQIPITHSDRRGYPQTHYVTRCEP